MSLPIKACEYCLEDFIPVRRGQRFDADKCQRAAKRLEKRNPKSPKAEVDYGNTHIWIPDNQNKAGVPYDHLRWIGQYISDTAAKGNRKLTIINAGDFWDMPSLSSYDRGKKSMEGRRYLKDIAAGNKAMEALSEPFAHVDCRRVLLRGNHEDRITRAIESDAQLDGLLSLDDLKSPGWEVIPFLEPEVIDGISYSHYFYNPFTGKSYGGAAATRLKTLGHSFTMGHQQILDYSLRFLTNGRSQHALIAGSCYLHEENYLGPQGNSSWMGIVICHNVENGSYDPKFVSLDSLCKRYEGMRLADYKPRYIL